MDAAFFDEPRLEDTTLVREFAEVTGVMARFARLLRKGDERAAGIARQAEAVGYLDLVGEIVDSLDVLDGALATRRIRTAQLN